MITSLTTSVSSMHLLNEIIFNLKAIKDLFLVGNIKNDLVKYFMQHIRNGLIFDLINS